MRFFGLAVAWLAVGLAAGLPAAARAQAPACHAALEGDRLTTAIEFPNGYKVEGPWRVDRGRPVSLSDGNRGVAMAAGAAEPGGAGEPGPRLDGGQEFRNTS